MVQIAESQRSYFQALGFDHKPSQPGSLLARAFETLGPKTPNVLLTIPVLREYFFSDQAVQDYSKMCESIATLLCQNLQNRKECEELIKKFEHNPDHGWDHIRRAKKWKKWLDRNDSSLHNSPDYLYLQLASFFSLRLHDVFQVYTGLKEGHDSAGALFAFGFIREHYNEINNLMPGENEKIPYEDWENQAWGAAFMIRHHSLPEKMPLETIGLLSLTELLNDVEFVAKKHETDIYTLFPAFGMIRETIDAIRWGEIDDQKQLTRGELEAVRMQTHLVSAADKLDSYFPADLSAARTVLTRPTRPFYTRVQEGLSLEDELEIRITDGRGENEAHESTCDLNRLLFELTRTEGFMGKSAIVSRAFGIGLREKANFFVKAIPALLKGTVDAYANAYEELETREISAALEKNLKDSHTLDWVRFRIRNEKATVVSALEEKIKMMYGLNVTSEEKKRIVDLVSAAVRRQEATLRIAPGPNIKPPYTNYFAINPNG